MISSENLRTTILAIGLSFLVMMIYVTLKFNNYTDPVYEYTLENEIEIEIQESSHRKLTSR